VNFDEIDQNKFFSRHPHSSLGFLVYFNFITRRGFLGFNMAAQHGMRAVWNFPSARGMAHSFSKQMKFPKWLKYSFFSSSEPNHLNSFGDSDKIETGLFYS